MYLQLRVVQLEGPPWIFIISQLEMSKSVRIWLSLYTTERT